MAKRILAGILAISMLAGCACGLTACANHEKPTEEVTAPADEMAEAIESLKKQIAELQTLIKNLSDKYTEDNEARSEQIKKLQEENKKLSDRLNMLEHQNAYGYFYTLQEAYDKGLLTQADLMNIAYYHNSSINWAVQYIPEDYVPVPKNPETLSQETETAIKQTYFDEYFKADKNHNTSLDDIYVGDDYYGTYNNCVAVMVWCADFGYACVIGDVNIGGVRFLYSDSNEILIWVSN